jgi:membrane-bound lytic murein transglycosylase D
MKIHNRILVAVILTALTGVGFAMGWSEPRMLSSDAPSSEEGSTESTVAEGETTDAEKIEVDVKSKIPWQSPQFEGQVGALGWSPDVFNTPEGMAERVRFWRDIYTKYSTDQGILHDSLHISVIYEEIDFRPIMKNMSLNDSQKRKARKKLVDERKKALKEKLAQLEKITSPEKLSGEDLRLWSLFSSIDEPNKFRMAQSRKRLRFQLGQSDRFQAGIYFSGRYLHDMEKIFHDRGLPIELTRLPFVESSFNVKARSRVGASGIWQFMRYTGKKFMRISGAVDERNDPLRAAEAAAKMFRINFEMLGQWSLAITGYNHGAAGVQRVVKKFHTEKISDLVDERNGRFGFASANFFACFLAALQVEREAKKYFGEKLYWDAPIQASEIRLSTPINNKALLSWFGQNEEKAKDFNPHIQQSFWAGQMRLSAKDFVRIPTENYEKALADLKNFPAQKVERAGASETEYYSINKGETLSDIAAQLGISVNVLRDLNEIENPRSIRAGQKLIIPKSKN